MKTENVKVGMEVRDFGGELHSPMKNGTVVNIVGSRIGIQNGSRFWVRDAKWLDEVKLNQQ